MASPLFFIEDVFLQQVSTLGTILAATFVIAWIVNTVLRRSLDRIMARSPSLRTTYTFIRRLVMVLIILVGVSSATFAAFPSLGAAITSLFVAAGFASIVIGLAAQSTLSNIVSGIMVSISQPFKLNEAVMFQNEFCFVEDIKLMYTVLRTWDNRRLMVPNSLIQSEVVVNYDAQDPTMLVPVFATITYESDLQKAMDIMVDIAKKHPQCLPIGDLPNAVVMEFQEHGIRLRLLSRAKNQPTAFAMARDILKEIKKEFDINGIELAYPRTRVTLDPKTSRALEETLKSKRTRREAAQTGPEE